MSDDQFNQIMKKLDETSNLVHGLCVQVNIVFGRLGAIEDRMDALERRMDSLEIAALGRRQ